MRAPSINQQDVSAAAERLMAAGVRPTARAVRDELGRGSMATVLRLLQSWQATQGLEPERAATLPAALQRALLEFAAQEASAAKGELAQELAATVQAQKELLAEHEAQASRLESVEQVLAQAQAALHQSEGRYAELQQVSAQLQQQAEALRQQTTRLELDNALLTQRLQALPPLEAEITRLREALEAARGAQALAEKQAAVAQAKLER